MRWVISFRFFFSSSIMNRSLTKMLTIIFSSRKIRVNSNFESGKEGLEVGRSGCSASPL